jgi:hypothetical protein
MSNEDIIKENSKLKTKISLLSEKNKELRKNVQELQDTFGYEICQYFNKCNSLQKTTRYFYFENVFNCYEALVKYFGCYDPVRKADDYNDCYQIIFDHKYSKNNFDDSEDDE